jgi:N-acetylornithine carbamoyltransferase
VSCDAAVFILGKLNRPVGGAQAHRAGPEVGAPHETLRDLRKWNRHIGDLLALAQKLEHSPEPKALAGRVLGLLFMNPSLRTLASFQSGMARLGGSSFVITPGQGTWNLETKTGVVMNGDRAEHIREGLPVLASYADALGIRCFAEGRDLAADLAETGFNAMAELVNKPLINMESAMNHPARRLRTEDDG